MPPPVYSDLAPWSHTKAQRWFETLLERSGLITEIEDRLTLDVDLELPEARMLAALLILLGRPGIWPDRYQNILQKASIKISKSASEAENSAPGDDSPKRRRRKRPLSLEQHQKHAQAVEAIRVELELLRRRAGISKRKTVINQPDAWGKFWG